MKKIKVFIFALLSTLLYWPAAAFAASQVETSLRSSGISTLFGFGGVSGSQTLGQFIVNVIRMLLTFAAGIAVLFVIIGGFQYITSHGNEEQSEAGKKTLVNAIIGIVLIVLSYAIITVVANTASSSGGFGFF